MVDQVELVATAVGHVSASEYRQMIETWNGRATDTDSIFPALDSDGEVHAYINGPQGPVSLSVSW